jgi:CysZ protein
LSIFAPFQQFRHGFAAYLLGLRWLRAHKVYWALLLLPMILGFAIVGSGWSLFWTQQDFIFDLVLFSQPDSWWGMIFWYIGKFFVVLGVITLGLVSAILLVNVISSPVYDYVSIAVERDIAGSHHELSLWNSLKMIPEELKRTGFILLVSLVVLMIPVLNTLTFVVTAFLLGWDFYDYPLSRRGWSFAKRLRFVTGHFWSVMGFGLWLIIPLVQFVMSPFAVVGGTLLAMEHVQERG